MCLQCANSSAVPVHRDYLWIVLQTEVHILLLHFVAFFHVASLLSKNESVLNILVCFLEQFQRLSQGLQPPEHL